MMRRHYPQLVVGDNCEVNEIRAYFRNDCYKYCLRVILLTNFKSPNHSTLHGNSG